VVNEYLELDLRITLETDDHALIYMTQGLRHGPPDVITALSRGESSIPRVTTFEQCRDSRLRRKHTHSWIASSPLVLAKLVPMEHCTKSTRSCDCRVIAVRSPSKASQVSDSISELLVSRTRLNHIRPLMRPLSQ